MQFKYIHIGKLVASFGVDGQIILVHGLGKKSTFKGVEALFVEETKGSQLPYFLVDAKAKTEEESYIKLEGINTKEATKRLIGKPIWLLEDDFRKHSAKQSAIGLIGYVLLDKNKPVGEIIEVIEQPHQVLLTVLHENKEAYVPMHENNLIGINHSKKQVNVEIPEGLLDIYL